ncbi:MAG TPA: PilN domain-containing protein [Arenimonas sp.]|nr:PilN domain-containing protein [Arenimonas sp.]
MIAERLNPSLDALRLRAARTPLPAWWSRAQSAVLALLPTRWRRALLGDRAQLAMQCGDGELQLLRLVDGVVQPLGALPLDDAETLRNIHDRLASDRRTRRLLLADRDVLRRRLTLPLAAEPRLRELLRHEIDRQTPFSAEQACFAGRVLQRDLEARQLQVELVVLPRARLQAVLAALGPLADGLQAVDVLDGQQVLGIDLLPDAQRTRSADPARHLQWQLLAGSAVLLLGALLLILDNRSAALQALRAEVETARTDVRAVRALRNQLQSAADAASFLALKRAARPTMIELIDDLTRRIPDHTSLDKLAVNDGRLVLVGLSRSAASTVPLLQESPLLLRPALAGAVQTDARSGRERFTLTATVQANAAEADDAQP